MGSTEIRLRYLVSKFSLQGLKLIATACCLTQFAAAQIAVETPRASTPATLTREDLDAFLDGLILPELRRDDIAGAVIAIVKDGKLLFAKGYGYADVERRQPVSFETTLFRIGSVSKPFVWTAVLQMAEQGKLDLDRDVNQYLDFQIPASYPQPITLRHLITHTAGFQETIRGVYPPEAETLRPLKDSLIEFLPPRIFPPGTTPAYSNYGATLAAYIVQRVSGQPFEEYADEHIFRPLGMTHTTFVQPLPDSLKPFLSRAYTKASEPARPFEFYHYFPAGGLAATAEDMVHFMIANLQEGRFGDAQILKPDSARLMHERQLELAPGMPGMTFGFSEGACRGYRYIGHGGDVWFFHTQLALFPSLNLGVFFSANTSGLGDPRAIILRSIIDRYFPVVHSLDSATVNPSSDTRPLSGYYKATRRWDSSVLKLRSLYAEVRISANADGTITSDRIEEHGQLKPLSEVAPLRYCDDSGDNCIAFRRDASGRLEMVTANPYEVFQQVPWYEERPLNLIVIIASALVFAITLGAWSIAPLTRWHLGRRLTFTRIEKLLRRAVGAVCAIDLFCIVAGRTLVQNLYDLCYEPRLHAVQMLGIAGAFGTLLVAYYAAHSLTDRNRWWFSKVHAVLVALACIGFVWFALVWRLFDLSERF